MSEPNPPDNETRVSPPRVPTPETLKNETTQNRSDANPLAPRTAAPSRLGRFEIRQVLGEGAFGCVYLAFDPELHRQVAIKVPHRDGLTPAFRERFLREARATATIHHPNVCPVYDVGTDGDVPYIVMHFVVGGTLAGLLDRQEAPLPPRHALAIARKLALGMAAAHAQGVIHRDLKPANVLYDKATREVLITDFGLARLASGVRQTADGSVFGTPAYMSPEQARGKVDEVGPHSDVYALGVILYRMLTGEVPFTGSVFEVMVQHWEAPPRAPSAVRAGLDPKLDAICLRAMAKAPADRYPSAKAFASALADYLREGSQAEAVNVELAERTNVAPPPAPAVPVRPQRGQPVPPAPPVTQSRPPQPPPRPRPAPKAEEPEPVEPHTSRLWLWGIGAALALFVASVGLGVVLSSGKPKPVEVGSTARGSTYPPTDQTQPVMPPVVPPFVKLGPKGLEPEPKGKLPEPKKEPEPKKAEPKPVAFKEVQPIFRLYCGNCHGDAGKPKGGVDLRTVASMLKGGDNGAIINPGTPATSTLHQVILDQSMPPDGKSRPTPAELNLIRDWIASGAKE